MDDAATDPLLSHRDALLRSLGYAVEYRESTWHECLLHGHGEAWIGYGTSPTEALEDSLSRALPSQAARELLRRALQRAPPDTGVTAPADDHGAAAGEDSARADELHHPMSPAPPTRLATEAQVVDPLASAATAAPTPTVIASPGSSRRPPRPRAPSPDLLASYDAIEEAMDEAADEGSLLEPERQRLMLLSWIARARDLEAQACGHSDAHDRTYRVAQRCARLAKIWWPGSVGALALEAQPLGCSADFPSGPRQAFANWLEVAEAAEFALEARELQSGQDVDDHGWRDGRALEPRHGRSGELLREIVAALERISGPIRCPREDPAGVLVLDLYAAAEPLDLAPWIDLAKKLRWLRGSTTDVQKWGAAMGRMRWLAGRLRARSEPLRVVLDPAYCPPQSWATTLGYDPDKRRKQREKKELVSVPPAPGWSDAALRTWILRAIDLGDALPSERLAALLEPVSVETLLIDPRSFSDQRRQRVRLEAVQRLLRKENLPDAQAAPTVAPEDGEGQEATFQDSLLALVRPFTRGRVALFVSNRNDPIIDEQVRRLFEFGDVDHCEVKPSTLSAKARSIEQGSYDFVLAATGFLSHTVDGQLKAAAKRGGAPYVSVNRGRPLSCALGLVRELGLTMPGA